MSHSNNTAIPQSYTSAGYKDSPCRCTYCDQKLESAFNLFDRDTRVRAIVLTGAGKSFCVGMDLSGGPEGLLKIKQNEKTMKEWKDPGGRVALAISNCIKPTIVAVNATIRVACKDAKLSMPFARRGFTMESVSAFYLPKLVGLAKAMHMTATGNTYAASDPMVSGLFSNILPTPEATLNYAVGTAVDMAENTSLMSTKMMRDLMLYCPDTPEETHLLDSRTFIASAGSPDNVEGLGSFMEKRKPEFAGGIDRSEFPFWPWWKPGAKEAIPGLKAKL
uniref:Enoyl-hydratase isomerase family protein n=1 Tax=Colletotrichum fructicola (strain Nara gc5) TaxID=1213859 RepID=L2FHX4_COLFN